MSDLEVVGKSVARVDAVDKVTGRALYTSDLKLPGMLHGAFLRSLHAHARIKKIDTSQAEKLPGVKAVLTQASVAGRVARIVDEALGTSTEANLFAGNKVTCHGEKIAAVAALTREIAEEAVRLIVVDYKLLPALVDSRDAVKSDATNILDESPPVPGPDFLTSPLQGFNPEYSANLRNVLQSTEQEQENVEERFAQSDHVFEDSYVVPRAHQSYIEPQVAIADVAPDGRVHAVGQASPFVVRLSWR